MFDFFSRHLFQKIWLLNNFQIFVFFWILPKQRGNQVPRFPLFPTMALTVYNLFVQAGVKVMQRAAIMIGSQFHAFQSSTRGINCSLWQPTIFIGTNPICQNIYYCCKTCISFALSVKLIFVCENSDQWMPLPSPVS